jgi:hypothetical protein
MNAPGPGPSAELRARILDAARRSPSPPRGARASEQAFAMVCGFAVLGGVWVRLGVHPGTRPLAYIVLLVAAWTFVAVASTWGGVLRGASMLGRSAASKAVVAGLTPIALAALWWPLAEVWPSTLERDSGWFAIAQCLVGTGLLGIGPLLAFLYVNRRSQPVQPWLSGAALGASAGVWGAVALVIICRHASASHILLGHVLPVALMALIGAAFGQWALAIRANRD